MKMVINKKLKVIIEGKICALLYCLPSVPVIYFSYMFPFQFFRAWFLAHSLIIANNWIHRTYMSPIAISIRAKLVTFWWSISRGEIIRLVIWLVFTGWLIIPIQEIIRGVFLQLLLLSALFNFSLAFFGPLGAHFVLYYLV